jgi:2-polyprenyl-3-methyl-5-hydroxy-6-metoxy-1,4-benzoquinol methylase
MSESFDLGQIPFYWRTKKNVIEEPLDIPSTLPFSFAFKNEFQLIIQKHEPSVLKWLERVYTENSNVGYLQDGHVLAESYGGEFIEFFQRAGSLLPTFPTSAVDIGCGGVYLLQKLRDQGLDVKGVDPSPITVEAGKKVDIEIVPDFYPSPAFVDCVDVLFHYDVLEHVEDPVAFLKAHHVNLKEHGAIIFAVPDCTHHIQLGDVSMVLHEHLNYFDKESLELVVRAAGFRPLILESANNGGVLFCCAVPDDEKSLPKKNSTKKFKTFCDLARIALDKFISIASTDGDLGLYVPLRAFPYLGKLREYKEIRFFDDNPDWKGRYFDGSNTPVENFDDLLQNPPSKVIICSLVFGHKIAKRLLQNDKYKMDVVLWSELFLPLNSKK